MRIKHLIYIFGLMLCILLLPGCAVLKKLKPQVNIQAQKADGDANIAKLEGNIEDLIGAVNAQGNAIAGVNNEVKNLSAGRDVITTTTETADPGLMKAMMKYWWMIFVFVIVKEERDKKRIIKEKKFYKDRFLAIGIKNEKELEELRRKHNG